VVLQSTGERKAPRRSLAETSGKSLAPSLWRLELGDASVLRQMKMYGERAQVTPGVINSVCSCCSHCCGRFSGVLRFGRYPRLPTSPAIAATDTSSCADCGECVDRCQFGARELLGGSLAFSPDLCFGCGPCVSACPTYAIALVHKQWTQKSVPFGRRTMKAIQDSCQRKENPR
jgi:ferredoxin